uniref:Uncharacterized protein n=1 Tax=Populus alba TaxID=43335 RepID=A0A4U5P309_POPAL|nr:hypothetical protein D5086_0000231700 [Populus alba]
MPVRYSYSDIRKITRGFKDKLGEEGFELRSGRFAAVKLLGKSKADGQDFINEVASVASTPENLGFGLVGPPDDNFTSVFCRISVCVFVGFTCIYAWFMDFDSCSHNFSLLLCPALSIYKRWVEKRCEAKSFAVIYSGTRAVMAPLNVNCGTVLIYLCKDNELRVSHASPTGYSQVNNENACSRQPAKSSTK